MTIKDDEKFCVPCKKIGLDRKAHRIMPGGGGRCDEHFRDEQGLPQLSAEATRFIELCKEREKHPELPRPAPPEPPDPFMKTPRKKKEPVTARKAQLHKDDALFRRTAKNGDGFTPMIENLKRKRAVIDDAIEKLENARAALEKLG